ncbi:hypothetical protein [Emticicia aquatilis]|nr:hypothetical protein [Emticicia aquatilis]
MKKKPFFIKSNDTKNKRKALEHFDKEENKITGDVILGGWRESISSVAKAGDIENLDIEK